VFGSLEGSKVPGEGTGTLDSVLIWIGSVGVSHIGNEHRDAMAVNGNSIGVVAVDVEDGLGVVPQSIEHCLK